MTSYLELTKNFPVRDSGEPLILPASGFFARKALTAARSVANVSGPPPNVAASPRALTMPEREAKPFLVIIN